MKKLMSSILVTSLVLVVSVNTSFAQQAKERTKADLNVAKTEKLQADVSRAYRKEVVQQKHNNLKARPIKQKAKIKAKPAQIRIEKR